MHITFYLLLIYAIGLAHIFGTPSGKREFKPWDQMADCPPLIVIAPVAIGLVSPILGLVQYVDSLRGEKRHARKEVRT